VPPHSLIEEDAMPRRLRHTIRHTEQICRGCWEVRTQTEDGHQLSAFGITLKQAIYRVHQKAKAYGRYAYPTAAARERRDGVAHRLMTFVQDGSRAYHQPCAASVALSRQAMYCDVWSGESLPPDLCCAACGRAIAQPLPDQASPMGLASCGGGLYAEARSRGGATCGQGAGVEGDAMGDDERPVNDAARITRTYQLLSYAARRAQDEPAYVAWALARVQVREGLSDEALAARLGLPTVDLPRLALCLRPRPDQWDADLTQIAGAFRIDPNTLAAILRAVEAPTPRRQDPTV
jgi:hypothetical protein